MEVHITIISINNGYLEHFKKIEMPNPVIASNL